MLKGITFANPNLLFLLLLIPLLAAWYFFRRRRNNAELQVPVTEGFLARRATLRYIVAHGVYVLRLLAIALLIIAMARPQSSLSRQDIKVEGIDIILTLDISGSMLAMDFKPNRLEAAKSRAMEFIDSRPNDRIGLVVFSGEAFTQSPLTIDHSMIKNLFKDVQYGIIEDQTALGDGLATAINRLKNSQAVSKVIILLTDGVNNTGALDPRSAAEIAKMYGIRIYTIGIGTNGPVPYPMTTMYGTQVQYVEIPIDEQLLKDIAAMTNGKYFRATGSEKLRSIYQEIDKLEKSKIDVTEFRKKKDEAFPILLLAFGILALESLIRYLYLKNIP